MSAEHDPPPLVTNITKNFMLAPTRLGPRKVAVIGYTHSNRLAPWDAADWEIWGMNNMHQVIRDTRWDRWFDLHDRRTIAEDPTHEEWLRQEHPFPIYMMCPGPEFPSSVPFPRDELVARFGLYFTNTVSWQVAYATTLVEWAAGDGDAEIGVWGVDMAQGTEYAAQRPSCEYHIGLARGMGITVTVPDTSDLLKTASLYGSSEGQALHAKLTERGRELRERLGGVRQEKARAGEHIRQMEAAENQLLGAIEQTDYLVGTWLPPVHNPETPRAANDLRANDQK